MSKKAPSAPVWWKNTFFWIAGILVLLGIWGFIGGEAAIRDPGQIRETGLSWIYFGGAVLMLVNGLITHAQAVQSYNELGHGDSSPTEDVDQYEIETEANPQ